MATETEPIQMTIEIAPDELRRLQHLADALTERDRDVTGFAWSVKNVLDELIDHVDQAIYRPGSWERSAFAMCFGGEALDLAMRLMYANGDEPQSVTKI